MFVSWHDEKHHLRGCIGTFSPRPILQGLTEYAKISAFRDHRFDPIRWDEVPNLSCSVSLLTNFEEILEDPLDWTIGKHGIKLSLKDEKTQKIHSATFLPEVAQEQAWTQKVTFAALIKKSGINSSSSKYIVNSIITGGEYDQFSLVSLVRYQSSITRVHHNDWISNKAKV